MPKQVNITVLGDGGVGKSSVTTRYVNNEFLESYDPTIQDSFRKSEIIDGEEITVEILDTAGQEDYVSINDTSIMQGQGFLIVFSLISRASFETVEDIIKKVYHLRECDVSDENKLPLVICGNKCDLESQRAVSKEEASSFASGKSLPYYECKYNIFIYLFIYFN